MGKTVELALEKDKFCKVGPTEFHVASPIREAGSALPHPHSAEEAEGPASESCRRMFQRHEPVQEMDRCVLGFLATRFKFKGIRGSA